MSNERDLDLGGWRLRSVWQDLVEGNQYETEYIFNKKRNQHVLQLVSSERYV